MLQYEPYKLTELKTILGNLKPKGPAPCSPIKTPDNMLARGLDINYYLYYPSICSYTY